MELIRGFFRQAFLALGVGDEHDDTGELLSLLTLLGQQVHPMP